MTPPRSVLWLQWIGPLPKPASWATTLCRGSGSPPRQIVRDADFMATTKAIETAASAGLSVKEMAILLDRSVRQIHRYEAAGKCPPRKKVGHERRYPPVEIAAKLYRLFPQRAFDPANDCTDLHGTVLRPPCRSG